MLIDTHCHLDFQDFDGDRDEVIERAKEAGVGRIINVGSSIDGSRRSLELAKKYDLVFTSIGIHPHEAATATPDVLENFKALARDKKVVAVGEVGLDYYRNLSPKDEQVRAFRLFIRLADEMNLPIIIHSRQADAEMLDILRSEKKIWRGVIHCFSGDGAFLKACLEMGFFASFTCNLTFKKADDLRQVARHMPVERLLLETDAPYLAPQALRGKRNEPANLKYLVEEWSRLLGLSKDDIERITTHNANELFGLGIKEEPCIAYPIRDCLYLNITNDCTNDCVFCVRKTTPFVKGHNLRLARQPSIEELLKAIGDPSKYREIVFCGYGEPTLRLDVIKAVAAEVKKHNVFVRVVTNGHGDLIHKRSIVKELAGLVDKVSVSLNADTPDKYMAICRPRFGKESYKGMLAFIKDCIAHNIEAELTCVDMPELDVKECEAQARGLGASFRARKLGVTG